MSALLEEIRLLRAQGWSVRAIAQQVHLSKSSVGRKLGAMEPEEPLQDPGGQTHGWIEQAGRYFFLLPLPEMVICPGCGQPTNHLWICWGCRTFFSPGCQGEAQCTAHFPLDAFRSADISGESSAEAEEAGLDEAGRDEA